MNPALFEIRNLTHRYKSRTVLEDVSFDLFPGTITGVTGPNGSGKSTLINILGLIIEPYRGTVKFMGEPAAPFLRPARGRIATLTQDSCLLKRSVRENVAYGLAVQHDTKEIPERVDEALEAVGLSPALFARRSVKALSGGEARRVALAARLILKPRVLLLDEPTAHVDEESNAMIRRAVLQARSRWGTTLMISSHDGDWLESISDRTFTLFGGHLFRDERINIITGPFEKREDGWYKNCGFEPGHLMPVPAPPSDGHATGILSSSSLFLSGDGREIPDNCMKFKAKITGMTLSRDGGHLFISMAFHDQNLVAMVERGKALAFSPGQEIFAYYSPSDLTYRC